MSLVATDFFFLTALRSSEDLPLTISPFILFKDNFHCWDFLAAQWIRLHAPKAEGLGSILGWRTKMTHATGTDKIFKKKKIKNKFSLWHVPLTLVLRHKNSVSYTITFLVSIFLCASKYVARREVGVKKRNILSSLQAPFQSWF